VALDHPDAERLAEYADGVLKGVARADVERHLAECDECRDVLADTSLFLAGEHSHRGDASIPRQQSGHLTPPRRRVAIAVGGALALAASLLVFVRWFDQRQAASYEDLIVAVGESRPVDGRLWQFDYGRLASATRGDATPFAKDWKVLAAAARIRSAAQADPSPANLHALGVAHLVLGEYDDAVRNLEMAVSGNEMDARSQNDLAVAYATRAARLQRPADFARSLESAERAVKADPNLVEALFNRALALEALSLDDQARAAWKEYLQKDPEGPWAAEARTRLERRGGRAAPPFESVRPGLEEALAKEDIARIEQIADDYPLATTEYFLDELPSRWLARVRAQGDGEPERRAVQTLADVLSRRGADRAAAAVVTRINDAVLIPLRLRDLDALHRTFAEGLRLQRADRLSEASSVFARCGIETTGNPVALECAFRATTASMNSGDRTSIRKSLAALATAAEHESYLDVLGRIRWRQALVDALDGDLTGALGRYRLALDAFTAAKSTEHAANVHSLMSEILRMMGDVDGAWRQHLAALEGSRRVWSPSIRHQILVQTLLTSLDAGMPEVALQVADALIDADRAWKHQPSLALAFAHRARALTQLGRQEEALHALDEALRTAASVPDADYQRRFETEVLAARVAVFASGRPREALTAAERGLANVRYTRAVPREPGFLFARANAQASLGQLDAAEEDYRAALRGLEAERNRLAPDTLRISHLERTLEQVRGFVEFQLTRRNDPIRALEVLEQSRARWLLAAVRGLGVRPVSPTAIVDGMAADAAVVYYAVIGEAVHAWVVTRGGVVHRRLATSASSLEAAVDALWTTFQLGGSGERERLIELHNRLITPIRDAIAGQRHLVLVPDGPVFNVPVAALIDGHSGRYLVQDFSVSVSPSLTLARLDQNQRINAGRPRSVGIFGGNVPDKPFLAEIDAEQDAVEQVYASLVTRRYRGDKQEFLSNIGRHDIVHFAGHAVANVSDPALSRLEFASPDGLPSGDVLAQEILGVDLGRVSVVVLGACRTGWGANVAGEGVLSLSHAFLGAGARSVLGSLWDVDDRATRALLTAVHKAMASGQTLSEAVRTAQLSALASSDPMLRRPAGWAAFVATVRS
jgi:CHAT domain-containing protein